MRFDELILEADRSGYLLGSHSAREGEKVRGMPSKSAMADIGFYKRDPEEDVRLPNTPTPPGVKATFAVIVDAFNNLIKNQEFKGQFITAAEPFIQNYHIINTNLNELNLLIQRLASLERTLKTTKNEDRVRTMIGNTKEKINDVREILEPAVQTFRDTESNTLSSMLDALISSVDDKDRLKNALDRYFSVVEQRKQVAEQSGGMTYLLISPVLSMVRFYNNAQNQQAKQPTDITRFKSSEDVIKSLEQVPQAKGLIELHQLVKLVAPKIRSNPEFKNTLDYKAAKMLANEKIKTLKQDLPELVYNTLLVFTNRFFNNDVGAEGKLLATILNTAPKALLAKSKEQE